MRLFVAAELPPILSDALSDTSVRLRGCVEGRFVDPDLFHVTLAFLGEVPQALAGDVATCVRTACTDVPPLDVALGAFGTFGRIDAAMLWQGFSEGESAWRRLARDVRAALRKEGFSYDTVGFVPHVTLMRRADVSSGCLPMPCVERGTVRTVTLFRSDLSGPQPRYEALERIDLHNGY